MVSKLNLEASFIDLKIIKKKKYHRERELVYHKRSMVASEGLLVKDDGIQFSQ